MVSSTFFDLSQIRRDLEGFVVDELGYRCLLSELPSFPVDPDSDTIENCRRRVEEDTDILVLVIGARYGTIDHRSEKSITNLEYLAARQKGIPVYAFVAKTVLDIMPVWSRNPGADFSGVVDTPRLFEFVAHVRDVEKSWTFSFETAQDVIKALRLQLGYLFGNTLRLRLRLDGGHMPDFMASLSPKALRLALEKPISWEYRLFLQVWSDAVHRRRGLLREYDSGLALGPSELVAAEHAVDWFQTRLHELLGLAESADTLVNESAQTAFGPPGKAGDAEHIVWTAQQLGQVLEEVVKWSSRVRRARVEDPFASVATESARFPDDMLEKLRKLPGEVLQELESALTEIAQGRQVRIDRTLAFNLSNVEAFEAAMSRAKDALDGIDPS